MMGIVTDEAREDAEWLRRVAEVGDWNEEDTERFKRIANQMEMFSNAMFDPGLQLEKQVEEELSGWAAAFVAGHGSMSDEHGRVAVIAALWLIQRRVANLGTKALTGSALSGLASVMMMSGEKKK